MKITLKKLINDPPLKKILLFNLSKNYELNNLNSIRKLNYSLKFEELLETLEDQELYIPFKPLTNDLFDKTLIDDYFYFYDNICSLRINFKLDFKSNNDSFNFNK